jgi:hypothetical protein
MPISNANKAVIPPEKLAAYLLNPLHPVGGPKATWLLSLGYQSEAPQQLATDLLAIVRTSDDFTALEDPFGVKYVVRGSVRTPSGKVVILQTIWIQDHGMTWPRFVSAYPARSS